MANSSLLNRLIVYGCALLLAGCATVREPKPTIVNQPTLVYPDLGPVPASPKLNIEAWHFNLPRDTSKPLKIKNVTACKSVTEAERNQAFWLKCGVFPVDLDSNLYVGLTKQEYDKYVIAMAQIKRRLVYDQMRIQEENARRARWRKLNGS